MYKVIEANLDDVEEIWELGKRIESFLVSLEEATFWPKDVLHDCIINDDVIVNVAKREAEIIGFIIANCNKSLRKAEVENIYVKPEHRNKGVGSSLLGRTVEELSRTQFNNICALENNAIEFYRKSSFKAGNQFTCLDLLLSDGPNR